MLQSAVSSSAASECEGFADLRPTAAAIAYGLDKKGSGERNVLIYDACLCIPSPFPSSSTVIPVTCSSGCLCCRCLHILDTGHGWRYF